MGFNAEDRVSEASVQERSSMGKENARRERADFLIEVRKNPH